MINREAFEFIEIVGSVNAKELADKFGMQEATAANWLSRWCQKGYFELMPREYVKKSGRPAGRYTITSKCKWWGEKAFVDPGW